MQAERLDEFLLWQAPNLPQIISSRLLIHGGTMVIYGAFGVGKSLLANQLAFTIAKGEKFFSLDTSPSTVLYVQTEMPKSEFQHRVKKFVKHAGIPKGIYLSTEYYLKLDKEEYLSQLALVLEGITKRDGKSIDVLILDPLYSLLTGSISDSQDMEKFTDGMKRLGAANGHATIVVTHTRKSLLSAKGERIDFGAEEILGSIILPAWADSIVGMMDLGMDTVELRFDKHRHSPSRISPVKVKLDRDRLQFNLI